MLNVWVPLWGPCSDPGVVQKDAKLIDVHTCACFSTL